MVFVRRVEPLMSVKEGTVFPLRELGCAPGGFGCLLGRNELRKVGMDSAEVVVNPGESGIVNAVGGDEEIFWMIAFRGDKLGNRRVFDEDLA